MIRSTGFVMHLAWPKIRGVLRFPETVPCNTMIISEPLSQDPACPPSNPSVASETCEDTAHGISGSPVVVACLAG